jgi:hypothetical protein
MNETQKISESKRESLIVAYIERYSRLTSLSPEKVFNDIDINYWAYEKLDDLVKHAPNIAFELVVQIADRTENENVLDNLSAGPLEDLIRLHGPKFIDKIEEISRNNDKFKDVLRGVWQVGNPEIWERIVRASN